jgi:hypothetical protein
MDLAVGLMTSRSSVTPSNIASVWRRPRDCGKSARTKVVGAQEDMSTDSVSPIGDATAGSVSL